QKINGIKQTWHTIEFSNNHTNPTTPPHNVRPSSDSANKHDPRNIMNHTKHGADTTQNQIRKQSQIGMNGTKHHQHPPHNSYKQQRPTLADNPPATPTRTP